MTTEHQALDVNHPQLCNSRSTLPWGIVTIFTYSGPKFDTFQKGVDKKHGDFGQQRMRNRQRETSAQL